MKHHATKLLILSIICTILYFLLSIGSIKTKTNTNTNELLNRITAENTISDVEGYAYITEFPVYILTDISEKIGEFIFIILIPGFMLFTIIILQSISRLVQINKEKEWKNTTSQVLTYISIVLQVLVCLILLFDLLANFYYFNKLILGLALILNIICVIVLIKTLLKFQNSSQTLKS